MAIETPMMNNSLLGEDADVCIICTFSVELPAF